MSKVRTIWKDFGRWTFDVGHPLDYLIIGCLFLFAAFAPHSIAIAQGAWLVGMLFWVARFAFYPPPVVHKTPLDYALLGFFILTGVSTLFSYEPMVSAGKLRAASLFTIVYLVAQNIPSRRVLRLLVITLIASCFVNVLYTAGQRVIGRGVKVGDVKTESPLYVAGVRPGDTLLEVENQRIGNPEELVNALAASDRHPARVKAFRYDWPLVFKVEKGKLLAGNTALDELGIQSWSRDRSWRASGFYGHYVTYAEVLQLILALALALLISLPSKRTWSGVLLLVAFAGFGFALLLTMTRAAWLAFLISSTVIILLGAGRRGVIVVGALAIPLILAGLFILQQKRNVGFFDSSDGSTTWRITVWREGVNLLTSKPRHLLFGIGMDSLKGHWREWGMFDHGQLPIGHMHSNLLQIALERGIPALLVWLLLLFAYARMLWQLSRKLRTGATDEAAGASGSLKLGTWIDRGLTLGALGGLVGFFVSGLVHYNWGDSEVVMIFYFIMGLALVPNRMVADGQSFGRRASNSHKAS